MLNKYLVLLNNTTLRTQNQDKSSTNGIHKTHKGIYLVV